MFEVLLENSRKFPGFPSFAKFRDTRIIRLSDMREGVGWKFEKEEV